MNDCALPLNKKALDKAAKAMWDAGDRCYDWMPETIIFYDADVEVIQKWDVDELAPATVVSAVHDKITKLHNGDLERYGLPRERYINTGLFIFNRKLHLSMFEIAQQLDWTKNGESMPVFLGQSILNKAIMQSGTRLCFLPQHYNMDTLTPDTIVVHNVNSWAKV